MTEENHKNKNQVDELDLVKFQLLTSYLGLAKQGMQSIEDNKEKCRAELELLSYKEKETSAEVERINKELSSYYAELRQKYEMSSNDKLNFATGEIQRVSREDDRLHKSQKDQKEA